MSYSALHTSFKHLVKGQAFVPSYWLMLDRDCNRSQEISIGSSEGWDG